MRKSSKLPFLKRLGFRG